MTVEGLDRRTPVLVGVGTAARPRHASVEVEPLELMVEAARAALGDAAPSPRRAVRLVAALGSIAVPVGNWGYRDPARLVAAALGAPSARTIRVAIGVPQSTPVRVAAQRIAAGELDAAMVLGGEAMASRTRAARAGATPRETADADAAPDEVCSPEGELMAQPEIDAGLWDPVAQYACIETALAAAEGRDAAGMLDEVAALWARFAAVARTHSDAAFAEAAAGIDLRRAGPGNRPLAWPYAKWHTTQWGVDHGAALVLCAAELAADLGVPPERWLVPVVLVESSDSVSMSRRGELHRWPAMSVLGDAAASHLGRPLAGIDHVELYSCFPSAVRVQQRELGLPPAGTPTITGGMAFAGGPFNHFTYLATAAMAQRLRGRPGELGLVTTVSGLLTKPGLAVWSHPAPGLPPLLAADLGASARRRTEVRDVTGEHHGTATVVAHTVTYDGDRPSRAFLVCDLDDGRRWVATSDDPALVRAGTEELLAGRVVTAEGATARS